MKGLSTCSKKCRSSYLKQYYVGHKNPNNKYKTPIEKFFALKYSNLKSSAKKRKLDFNLTPGYLLELFEKQNGLCYYTGVPLKLTSDNDTFHSKNQPDLDCLSFDRRDNDKGYTQGNVVLTCNGLNKLKGAATEVDFINFLHFVTLEKSNCQLSIKKLRENCKLPMKNTLGDVGYDLFVDKVEDCGSYLKVYSGIAIQPSVGWYLQMYPRSSIYKKHLLLANSVGVCDNLYTGEYIGIFYKTSEYNSEKDRFNIGERFAQIVPNKYEMVEIVEVDEFFEGGRSTSGWGSSGR